MKAALLGAGGMLATDLAARAPAGVELTPLTIAELDVTDRAALESTLGHLSPDWVLNAAGYTRVDAAETDQMAAMAVNGIAPGLIGAVAARLGARVLHVSTDYVFAGDATRPYREDDPSGPLSAYGVTKLEGERRLIASGARSLIARTQWLYGANGPSFPRTMLDRARRRAPTRAVNDQFGRPTWTADLAEAIWALVGRDARGIYHAANSGIATWYDVAKVIFDREGAADCLTPCTSEEYGAKARRPPYGVLDTTKLERELGSALRDWREALAAFLQGSGLRVQGSVG